MKKSLKSLFLLFSVLGMGVISSQNDIALAESKDINAIPRIIFEANPETVMVGDKGIYKTSFADIEGIPVHGRVEYSSGEPQILKVNSTGEWEAMDVGVVRVSTNPILSDESVSDLKEAFPGANLIRQDIGIGMEVRVKLNPNKQNLYRLYNKNNGEHFYTLSSSERNNLIRLGWNYEGTGWYVKGDGSPVYRVYNKNSGEHFYTKYSGEVDSLLRAGWRNEGTGWYTQSSGVPVYRLFNPNSRNAGSHHFTKSAGERDSLVNRGWKYEGVAYYGE